MQPSEETKPHSIRPVDVNGNPIVAIEGAISLLDSHDGTMPDWLFDLLAADMEAQEKGSEAPAEARPGD